MLQPRESDVIEPGLVACLSETRIGLFDSSATTRTEVLSYVSGSSHRASVVSSPQLAADLVLFTQEDPIRVLTAMEHARSPVTIQAALAAPAFLAAYGYADEDPVNSRDPLGLGKIPGPTCGFWWWVCDNSSTYCKKTWDCFFHDHPPEDWVPFLERIGVSSPEDFKFEVCWRRVPSCQKFFQACGKSPT